MPIPDWSRVPAGIIHDFHQDLVIQIKRDLNPGILPTGYSAMAEPMAGGLGPDVLGLRGASRIKSSSGTCPRSSQRGCRRRMTRRCRRSSSCGVVRYRVESPGFRVGDATVVTTLLDAAAYPAEAAMLYFRRWLVNFLHRNLNWPGPQDR